MPTWRNAANQTALSIFPGEFAATMNVNNSAGAWGTYAIPADYYSDPARYGHLPDAVFPWHTIDLQPTLRLYNDQGMDNPLLFPQWHSDAKGVYTTPRTWRDVLIFDDVVPSGETVTPAPASAIGRVVAPTVVLGSVAVAPNPAMALGRVVAPTVVLGSLVLAPAARSAIGRVVAPTVVLGSLTLAPTARSAVGRVVAPSVLLGAVIAAPAAASTIGRTVAPTVVLGSLAVTPGPASALGRVVAPTVNISGGGPTSPTRRRIRWIYFHWRRFSRWT